MSINITNIMFPEHHSPLSPTHKVARPPLARIHAALARFQPLFSPAQPHYCRLTALKSRFLPLVAALLLPPVLAGCGVFTPLAPDVIKAPKYQEKQDLPRFGDWLVLPDCTLMYQTTELRLQTDGRLTSGNLVFDLKYEVQLVQPPQASFSTHNTPISLSGAGRRFELAVPYLAHTAALMADGNSFLTLRYRPLSSAAQHEANIPTRELVQALGYQVRECLN